ncbi:MAG: hypothetical protein M3406_01015 [Chloroflexota bacterium]|nr:hypothetical protein [Chloroflexota bacterium]
MSKAPSAAERLDRAVEGILDGHSPQIAAAGGSVDLREHPLVELASDLRTWLVRPPVAARFEARLALRLATEPAHDPLAWALRHPGRLIVTGAVGSAVGVGVTVYAVWRNSRRAAGAHRLLHR